MATYQAIIDWVKHEYGFTLDTCWIAHVKEICGLPLRKAPNRQDSTVRVNPCPADKVDLVKEAFQHFGMIT